MKTLFENNKFYAVIIVFLFIITSFVTFQIIRSHYQYVFDDTIAENKSTAKFLSTLLYEHQRAAMGVLESYARRPLFIDAVEKKDFNHVISHMRSLSTVHAEMDALFITDQLGTLWANYPVDSKGFGKNLAYRDWYKGVSKNWTPYVSTLFRLIVLEKGLAVAVSVPVFDKKGKVIGTLNASQDIAFLATLVKENTIYPKQNITLLDQEGSIIFSNTVPYEKEITKYPIAQVLEKAVAGTISDMEIADAKGDGRISYVSIAPVRGIGWSVIVGQEESVILKSLYVYSTRSAITGFVIFLLLTFCVFYVRREYKYRKSIELLQAEEKYRLMFASMTSGFALFEMIYDQEGKSIDCRYMDVNPAHEKLTGLEKEAIIGRTLRESVPGLENYWIENYGRVDKTGIPEYFENYAEGLNRWYGVSAYRTAPGFVAVTFENITGRKQAEENLRKERDRAQLYLNTAEVMLIVLNAQGYITLINKKGCAILGYTEQEILGQNWIDTCLPEEMREEVTGVFNQLMKGEIAHVEYYENPVLTKDGQQRILAFHNAVLRDTSSQIIGLLSSGEDITDRKQAEEEIRRLNVELEQRVRDRTAQLEAANKELEAFCYSVSHDLRAPLRHIDGYADLLARQFHDSLPDKGTHYLNTIVDSAHQMGVLIDDLLRFSRTGRLEIRLANLDMNDVLREALETVTRDATGRSIEWVGATLPHVPGDRALLQLVWLNLLSNAVKFTRTRDKARIEIGAREEDKEFVFSVRDNGVGFDMRYAHKLFGVFQRLHPAREFEGTGIGLANVRRIVHRHGGRTWAEGEPDRGAVFYFTLPQR